MKTLLVALALIPALTFAQGVEKLTPPSGPQSAVTRAEVATQSAMTLYVDAAGSDANSCAQTAPCATIQAAVNKVPKLIRHPVTINVGTGNFAGAYIAGYTCDAPSSGVAWATTNYCLLIQGTMATITPTTGAVTGTVTSFSNPTATAWGRVTVTAAGWTADDFKGSFFVATGGKNAGKFYPIVGNAATTIDITNGTASEFDNTTTFAIQRPASVINTSIAAMTNTAFYTAFNKPSSWQGVKSIVVGIFFFEMTGGSVRPRGSESLEVSGNRRIGSSFLNATGDATIAFTRNYWANTTGVNAIFLGQHESVSIQNNVFDQTGAASPASIIASGTYGYKQLTLYWNQLVNSYVMVGAAYIDTGKNRISYAAGSCYTVGRDHPNPTTFRFPGHYRIGDDTLTCQTGITAAGSSFTVELPAATSGTCSSNFINASDGAQVKVASTVVGVGTAADITIDAGASTSSLAAMRAATRKTVRDAYSGTRVYE